MWRPRRRSGAYSQWLGDPAGRRGVGGGGPTLQGPQKPPARWPLQTSLPGAGCGSGVVTRSLGASHLPAFELFRLPVYGRHNLHSFFPRLSG